MRTFPCEGQPCPPIRAASEGPGVAGTFLRAGAVGPEVSTLGLLLILVPPRPPFL